MMNRLLRFSAALVCLFFSSLPLRAEILLQDETGRTVRLERPARRIVSLAPHVTELLFAAGAGRQVVGVVAYSDYPAEALSLPQVGGYRNMDLEAILALRPDLVVGWSTGNSASHVDKLEAMGVPVYITEPRRLENIADTLEALGMLAGSEPHAAQAAADFRSRLASLSQRFRTRPPVRMLYQIWDQPLRTINGQHLISDVIRLCGGENDFSELSQIAPIIGIEGVLAADPEVIVASGMGEERPDWLNQWKNWPDLQATRKNNLFFIPPQLLQRHTPRILDGAEQLCGFLETARSRR